MGIKRLMLFYIISGIVITVSVPLVPAFRDAVARQLNERSALIEAEIQEMHDEIDQLTTQASVETQMEIWRADRLAYYQVLRVVGLGAFTALLAVGVLLVARRLYTHSAKLVQQIKALEQQVEEAQQCLNAAKRERTAAIANWRRAA